MSGSEPLVDVVIVAYCSAETLAASVGSVASDPAVADVIVVDNASPDDSAAVAEAAGARVVATGANLGFGGGCNRGAAAGRSPYVLFLNPDAAAQPGTVAGLAAHLAGSPRAGAVASELRFADGGRQPSRRRFPRWWLAPAEPGLSAELDERWYRRRARGPRVDWVTGACFLVRRAAFEAVGGFDERYFLYAEETDLCARLAEAGWEIHWIPGLVTVHESGRSTRSLPGAGKVAWVDGWLRFLRTHSRQAGLSKLLLVVGFTGRAAVWTVAGQRASGRLWWTAARRAMRG